MEFNTPCDRVFCRLRGFMVSLIKVSSACLQSILGAL